MSLRDSITGEKAKIALLFGNALLAISVIALIAFLVLPAAFTPIASDIFIVGDALLAALGAAVAVIAKALVAIEDRLKRLENR